MFEENFQESGRQLCKCDFIRFFGQKSQLFFGEKYFFLKKILVEICTLPCCKHKTFQGDDKALAWIAHLKWVHAYEQAINLYI